MTHSHGHGTAEDSAPHETGRIPGSLPLRGGEADPTSPGNSTPEPGEPPSSGEPADPGHDDASHGH